MRRALAPLLVHVLAWLGQHALGSEIINGKKVPDDMMPYMASVQNNQGHICGGFLVSEDFVITAAHCDVDLTHVVVGTHHLKKADNKTRRQIEMKCKHSFTDVIHGNDIMLLKLSQKVPLKKRVNLLQLPDNQKLKDNQKCRVAGWGWTKSGRKVVDDLQMVEVSVINRKVCDKQWQDFKVQLPENVTCAGGYKTKNGFSKGDSGGPLVCGARAAGIVSFNSDKNPDLPNIYTDISKYVPWIRKALKQKRCVPVAQ